MQSEGRVDDTRKYQSHVFYWHSETKCTSLWTHFRQILYLRPLSNHLYLKNCRSGDVNISVHLSHFGRVYRCDTALWDIFRHCPPPPPPLVWPSDALPRCRKCQAFIWKKYDPSSIMPLRTIISEVSIKVQTFQTGRWTVKCRPFCPGINVLELANAITTHWYQPIRLQYHIV